MHHHRVLHEALHQAIKWQILGRNVADAVEPPRPERKEMCALDEAETAKLLEAAQGSRMYTPILVAVTTGLRRGELLGLRWQDVELDTEILAVRQSIEQTRSGLRFKTPKTQKGQRAVALPSITVETLRRHRTEQNKERLLLGPRYADQGLVFSMPDGTPWEPDAFTDAYRVIARQSGLPQVRFHDLRHTHATQLLRQGIHPKVVSERLGHATVAITLDIFRTCCPVCRRMLRCGLTLLCGLPSRSSFEEMFSRFAHIFLGFLRFSSYLNGNKWSFLG
jgi:integrase